METKFSFLTLLAALILQFQVIAQVVIEIKPDPSNNKDAYVNSYNFYGQGTTPSNIAAAWSYGGEFGIGRSFIYFPLPLVQDDTSNFKAYLNLYYNYSATHVGHAGDNQCKIERILQPWNANNLNWSNQPEVTSESAVFLPASVTEDQDYINIDVTPLVIDMYRYPETSHGFRLSLLAEEPYRSMILASGDHLDEKVRPSLVISYDTCDMPFSDFNYSVNNYTCTFNYEDESTFNYVWDFGNGFGSNLRNPVFNFMEYGKYNVCLHAENNCGIRTMCKEIYVCQTIMKPFDYSIDSITFNFEIPEGFFNPLWDFGNGYYSTNNNPAYTFPFPGTYNVCLTASDSCSELTHCEEIIVSPTLGNNSPEFRSEYIKVYPIPATESFFVENTHGDVKDIFIYDARGILYNFRNKFVNDSVYQVFLPDRINGIFFLQIVTPDGTFVKKLILRN